jgi:Ca-activated chloride channel family protein
LSDGHANQGDSSLSGLRARARSFVRAEHVLTAMGIGDDFNEDLMTALADEGAGNFYYLSRVETLGRYFDAELRASTQTLARALELRFTPAAGVRVLSASGYPIDRDGGAVIVRPGNLYAGQKRTIWVTLAAPAGRPGAVALGGFTVAYKRGARAFETERAALPALACVVDEAAFERAIDLELWQDYVLNERLRETEYELGMAVGQGDAADVDRATAQYEQNRRLAQKLNATRVLSSLNDVQRRARETKVQQSAAPAERARRAKHVKARAQFSRRKDAYNDDPLYGLSEE